MSPFCHLSTQLQIIEDVGCLKYQWLTIRTSKEVTDLQIQGPGQLRGREVTLSFFTYSQKIGTPESFVVLFSTRKVGTIISNEVG